MPSPPAGAPGAPPPRRPRARRPPSTTRTWLPAPPSGTSPPGRSPCAAPAGRHTLSPLGPPLSGGDGCLAPSSIRQGAGGPLLHRISLSGWGCVAGAGGLAVPAGASLVSDLL